MPPRVEAWRPLLEADLRQMEAAFPQVVARWGTSLTRQPPAPRRVVVFADEAAAASFYQAAGLEGDPAVPRTFPAQRLAVVPLPRDDRLLAELPTPPQTWRHSFRHEMAHLLSLDDPTLREAPRWFQEGFAECWCDGRPDQPLAMAWPFPLSLDQWWQGDLDAAPAEVRYAALATSVRQLWQSPAARPWQGKEAPIQLGTSAAPPFRGLRGRDAWWQLASGRFLLAPRSRQQVNLDLPWTWDGRSPLHFSLQLGRTGEVEAGLLLFAATAEAGAQGARLRLRQSRTGGLGFYAEAAGAQARFESVIEPAGEPRPGRLRQLSMSLDGDYLRLEADGYRRSLSLQEAGLAPPFALQLYARDGVLQAQFTVPPRP